MPGHGTVADRTKAVTLARPPTKAEIADLQAQGFLLFLVSLVLVVLILRVGRRARNAKTIRAPPGERPGGIRIGPVHLPPEVACQGLIVYGEPGAGKSHFLLSLIRQLARARIPMVITTVRASDYRDIERVFREEGRLDMIRRSAPGSPWRLNVGEFFTSTLPGGGPRVLSTVLGLTNQVLNDTAGSQKGEAFWEGFYVETLLMGSRLLLLAKGAVNLDDLYQVIITVPRSSKEADSEAFYLKQFCGRMLQLARKNRGANTDRDYEQTVNFFVVKIAGVGSRARSAVQQMATNALGGLISDEFHDALCTDTTITPEIVERERLAWVLDYPLMRYHASGRAYQFLHTAAVDFWCLARDPATVSVPFYKIRDEAGWIASAQHDIRAQAVSRAQRLASVIAVQNINILESQLGGGDKGRQEAMALSAVHNTRLYFRNSCTETGEMASKMAGQFKEILVSGGTSGGQQPADNWLDDAIGVKAGGHSWSEQYQPRLRSEFFSTLPVGVAVLFTGGRHTVIDLRER